MLLWIDREPRLDGSSGTFYVVENSAEVGVPDRSLNGLYYHLRLLIEAGFIVGHVNPDTGIPAISRLSWNGHEFADNIRDSNIWGKTKERISRIAGVALGVVAEIAKEEVRKYLGLTHEAEP